MRLPFWGRRNRDEELNEELRAHLQMAVKDRVAHGQSPAEAEASVRREFGSLGLVKEVTREMWGWSSIERLGQDLRYGVRMLARNPGFTTVAVLTIALGIGANTAMFSVLNTYLLRPLPYKQSQRLVQVYRTSPHSQSWPHSAADFLDQRDQNSVFEQMAALNWTRPTLLEGDKPAETLDALDVTADFFEALAVQPELGRVFTSEEDQPGADLAVLSERFWRSRFDADPHILGRTLRLDRSSTVKVIGVMPQSFEQPLLWGNIDLWRPMALTAEQRQDRTVHYLSAIARLKPGVSMAMAQDSLATLATNIGEANGSGSGESVRLQPLQRAISSDIWRSVMWFTFGLAAFVLLIACTNVANLQLVRTAGRAREHAIRAALGAGRARLLRQSLTESLLISLLGGALSLVFAFGGVEFISRRLFINAQGAEMPLDFRVFGFGFVCSVLTGLIFGAVPALIASRVDVNRVLKEGLRGASSGTPHRMRNMLIAGEVAFTLALLTGAGLFLRGVERVAHLDPGWQVEGLLTAELTLQDNKYSTDPARASFYLRLEERLGALPGIQGVALSASQPAWELNSSGPILIEGQPEPAPGQYPESFFEPVSTDYFKTLGIRLLEGRQFTSSDNANAPDVIIVNETLARRFWPGESAIGKRVGRPGKTDRHWRQVVGVVNDESFPGRVEEPYTRLQIFRPLAESPLAPGVPTIILLRGSAAPEAMLNTLRGAVAELDPGVPVSRIRSARSLVDEGLGDLSLLGALLGAFAVLGLALAAIGIYGVTSYSVAERTGEIGVRMALGASALDVVRMVMGKGIRVIGFGAAAGFGGGYAVARFLAWAIPTLPTRDPVAMAFIALILVIVALVACFLPARRAAKVDPMKALRWE